MEPAGEAESVTREPGTDGRHETEDCSPQEAEMTVDRPRLTFAPTLRCLRHPSRCPSASTRSREAGVLAAATTVVRASPSGRLRTRLRAPLPFSPSGIPALSPSLYCFPVFSRLDPLHNAAQEVRARCRATALTCDGVLRWNVRCLRWVSFCHCSTPRGYVLTAFLSSRWFPLRVS